MRLLKITSSTFRKAQSSCCSQAECLMQPGVLSGRNLVFAAPTSAGKTIVYEVLALRRLVITQRPFLLVLPTVALCVQKVCFELLLRGPHNIGHNEPCALVYCASFAWDAVVCDSKTMQLWFATIRWNSPVSNLVMVPDVQHLLPSLGVAECRDTHAPPPTHTHTHRQEACRGH
jgi:hypothetical protein